MKTLASPKTLRAPWVVKIGGRLCDEPALLAAVAKACAAAEAPLVIVHGGGAQVTRLQSAFGITPTFVDGKRQTSSAEVRLVEMALSAEVGKSLVRELLSAGARAVGVSGVDAATVRCERVPSLGAVGVPKVVDTSLLETLLSAGYTVALSPVSVGPDGEALNVNADDVACAVAAALGAGRLLLVSDVPGVKIGGEVAAQLGTDDLEALIQRGDISGGMIPKVRAAAHAIAAGVHEVRIGGFSEGALLEWPATRISAGHAPTAQLPVPPSTISSEEVAHV